MPGPRPDDSYSPTPKVAPQTGMPNDTLSVRASADSFGSPIGQALEQGGAKLKAGDDQLFEDHIQQLGLANEHAAGMADMQRMVDGGKISNEFNNLEGLDAANSKDVYIQKYLELNNKIRSSLGNPAAQRAYDAMSRQQVSFTVQNMNNYAAIQQKKAYRDGRTAIMQQNIDNVSTFAVASDPAQVSNAIGNVTFDVNTLFTAPKYGVYQTIPAKTGADGKLQFDTSTDDGKLAQANYENYLDKSIDQVYTTAVKTLYNDPRNGSITKAMDFLEKHKPGTPYGMSAKAYADLSHTLSAPARMAETRNVANTAFSEIQGEYNQGFSKGNDLGSFVSNVFPGAKVSSTFRTPEQNAKVGGVANSFHLSGNGIDFEAPPGTTKEQVRDAFTHAGYDVAEVLDPEDARRSGEKDHFHVGVKSKPESSSGYRNFSDYVNANYDKLLDKGDAISERTHPGDLVFAEQARRQLTQQLQAVVRDQDRMNTVNSHNVYDYINKNNITNTSQLNNAPPEVRTAFEDLVAAKPEYLPNLEKVITSKSFARLPGYGPKFYENFVSIAEGRIKGLYDFGDDIRPQDGKNSPLTNTGNDVLQATLKRYQTETGELKPEGANFLKAQAQFLANERKERVGRKSGPYEINENFDHFIAQAIPMIEASVAKGQKEGKSLPQIAHELFTPKINGKDNPSYIRTDITRPDPSTLMKHQTHTFGSGDTAYADKFKNVDELISAYESGEDPKLTKEVARKIIADNHWKRPAAPSVPLPN